ncbi:Lectin-domain containing receptor kinase A4.3 [Hordeum vulgare]|nr:Lectin-domain containing receptor kinase A4.3 [Hordeum vulgare]
MDDDLDLYAAAGLASLASSDKGKPCASRKAAAPKPKKHGLVNAAVAAAVSIDSSAFPWTLLPDSPGASACNLVPGFHVYLRDSRLTGKCSPEVSVVAPSKPAVAPSTPAAATIYLNATPVAAGSLAGGVRKRARHTLADQLSGAHNLFDGMMAACDDDYMQNMIFEGGAQAAGFEPDETQSQDGRGYNEDQTAFMRDQVGLDLDGFPLDHEFPEDYGLEEEDECDIEAEPLFEDELANQEDGMAPKRKSKRTKAYTAADDKLLCECWRDIGQDSKTASVRGWVSISKRWRVIQQECNKFCATLESVKARPVSGIGVQDMAFQALEAFKVQHNGKWFNLSHCFRVIKDEEKFKAQYAGLKSHGGKQAVEEVGDDEKARSRGKTNPKKEDKRDAASIALIATVEGMITKKDSREEKRRQEREEQRNAFLEIQRRRLDMEAEKQARMLEMEAEKQAKMLEIEAANAKTKAKEVALASMMTGVEIMKVDLNTVVAKEEVVVREDAGRHAQVR